MAQNNNTDPNRLNQLAHWLDNYHPALRISEQGRVLSVGDGIAWVSGLPSAAMEDLIEFGDGSQGMVFDLTTNRIGAVLLRETSTLTAGTRARLNGRPLGIPVGNGLLGRIIDPLGRPLDGQPAPAHSSWQRLETGSPPIIARDFINKPMYTGIKIIDTLVPIGRGQRQLIVGDNGLGRSALALDTIINQRESGVHCVYVLIGQKRSTTVDTIETLKDYGALEHTTVVVAEASNLPGLQHLAPFAGCAVAEYWMQRGIDTLVVYDDLATHAQTYRELSLLLRRPPGREAYPGDIFSVHARLLERATCLNADHGGGSMTALPIVETKQGEIAAFIPTNLISITDGQIYLDRKLFTGGFRPAIDIARSVSRIGGHAQHPHIKDEAGRMKLDFLQFLELEVFTRFGARLESRMESAIARGRVLRELLKQDRLSPLPATFHMAWLVAFNDGLFDNVPVEQVPTLMTQLSGHVRDTDLSLDSPRADWSRATMRWLAHGHRENLEGERQ
ncbi:F0F1 ATP synthase subunit alpha [Marinobacter zhejiangensis]|uniref:ATP synthase subunit alpha n=1 Tax=Marinobacter zhejiangensis TaxID=488535 RepID=A0A1I4TFE0_9GAMM|nr:F0F1 ATP synthase subunit alpha [Marinobacter zhejiangensis]SFM75267.1 F-type H+-transporting ATPase subunit alpha [Marinobacter zhejiangensis]